MPQGVRPSDQAENNKTASRQRRNWLIKAASASKEIRLLLAPLSEEHPVSHGKPGRANNKNNRLSITIKKQHAPTWGGASAPPVASGPRIPRLPPFYTPSPDTMLESAAIMRPSFRMQLKNLAMADCFNAPTPTQYDFQAHAQQAGHYSKQCIPC